jgi:hypothetical protein
VAARLRHELRQTRNVTNLSARAVGEQIGWSHSRFLRFESGRASASIETMPPSGRSSGAAIREFSSEWRWHP